MGQHQLKWQLQSKKCTKVTVKYDILYLRRRDRTSFLMNKLLQFITHKLLYFFNKFKKLIEI